MIVTLRPEAEADIEEAARWYEDRTRGLGSEFLDALRVTLKSIGRQPGLYPRVHDTIRRAVMSRFPFGVFYTLEEDALVVLAVMHSRRNPELWRQRL